jgi:acyl-CoA dehydrogenase
VIEKLKPKAQAAGLWNLFLPDSADEEASGYGAGLTNQEYAPLAEIMGAVPWASEVFNCSAPDTGNMETIVRYGSAEHKKRWLEPLLAGEIRSAFAMTEPAVASSDATNIQPASSARATTTSSTAASGGPAAPATRAAVYIFMGKTDPNAPRHSQQSMVLVPADAPGVTVCARCRCSATTTRRTATWRCYFENVRVPASNILLGEGRGFEIAQGRLGPGRIHHCMRTIGLAERALELMCRARHRRVAFGKTIAQQTRDAGAHRRGALHDRPGALLTLKAAWMMDVAGNKAAKAEIAMIKVVAPNMACQVIDWAMQVHGGAA